jgi:hypothetical protein
MVGSCLPTITNSAYTRRTHGKYSQSQFDIPDMSRHPIQQSGFTWVLIVASPVFAFDKFLSAFFRLLVP